jgi:hypothetical protein
MTSGSHFIRYVDISTVERFADVEQITNLTSSVDITALDKDSQRALRAFRFSVQWKGEGRAADYRGEYERGGNPLAEES